MAAAAAVRCRPGGARLALQRAITLHSDLRLGALAFLVSVAFWPWLIEPATVPRWGVLAIGLPLASRLDLRRVPGWLLACGAAGLLWIGVGIARSDHGQLAGLCMLILSVAFVAGCAVKNLTPLMIGFGFGAAINSAVAVAQTLGWQGIPQAALPGGLFMNREILAEFAAPALVWLIVSRRWWLAAAGAPCLAFGERAALLAVAVGLVYGMLRSWKHRAFALAAVVPAAALSLVLLGPPKLDTVIIRTMMWRQAIRDFSFMGHGLGSYEYGAALIRAMAGADTRWAHSDVLQGFGEIGLPFALFLAPAAVALVRKGDIGAKAVLVALAVEAAVSFPLHLPATGFMAAIIAGSLVRCRDLVRVGVADGRPRDVWASEPRPEWRDAV